MKSLTAAQLIAQLQQLPPNTPIKFPPTKGAQLCPATQLQFTCGQAILRHG